MIESTNVPPKMKGIFSGKHFVFTFFYNRHYIEGELIMAEGSITTINF